MKIFVGNLAFSATEADVKKAFEGFGSVESAVIVMDKKGVKSRGFGFVEMPFDKQAQAAIAAMDKNEFMGRPLNVSPARPKTQEEREEEKKEKFQAKTKARDEVRASKENIQKNAWYESVLKKKGGFRGGRRTRSFARKAVAEPRDELKPWLKPDEKHKPWQKTEGQAKPWKKNNARPKQSRFKSREKAV